MTDAACVFCTPRIEPWVLWEGARYRLIADAFPRLPGHVLIITRAHVLHHADAPDDWWPELEQAMERMHAFLLQTCGVATFWENGITVKEVAHAHLHGLPIDVSIAPEWETDGTLLPVRDWHAVQRGRDPQHGYTFLATHGRRYLALDRHLVLGELRRATTSRTGETLDPATGMLRRGGTRQVELTRQLWANWTI